jgi:hypothetical protein
VTTMRELFRTRAWANSSMDSDIDPRPECKRGGPRACLRDTITTPSVPGKRAILTLRLTNVKPRADEPFARRFVSGTLNHERPMNPVRL